VGEALERRASEGGEEEVELLSLHFFHARRFEQAWRYSRTAGDQSRAKYAHVEAADFYRRALEAARQDAGIPQADVVAVLEALGDVRDRVGDFEEAAAALRSARRRLDGDTVAAARLLRREAEIAERSGNYAQSLRLLGRGLRMLDALQDGDASGERARLSIWYASGRLRQGRHREAARWCERAIAEAEAARDRDALAWAYMVLDPVAIELALPADEPYGQLALSIYEELGNLPRQATITLNLGGRAYYEGHWHEALEFYERARELYGRTGDTLGAADATFNIGEILCHQNRLEEGEVFLREAARVWRATGDRVGVALATSELARAAYRSGEPEQALPVLDEARAELRQAGAEVDAWETELRKAECLLFLGGRAPDALELLDPALQRVVTNGEIAEVRIPRLERLRAWAFAQQGRWDEARAAFEAAARTARLEGAEYEAGLSLDGLARIGPFCSIDGIPALQAQSAEILARLGVVLPVPAPPLDG
jgi:tetratricopeptide (TPR) repeat protein